jgi:hypothetical protein
MNPFSLDHILHRSCRSSLPRGSASQAASPQALSLSQAPSPGAIRGSTRSRSPFPINVKELMFLQMFR